MSTHAEQRVLPYTQQQLFDLVADVERLRNHLKIDMWIVYGGSWGSTLALAYAQSHPEHVKALIIRGIFACRRKEVRWLYQEGASDFFPDYWNIFLEPIPESERFDLVSAYHRRMNGSDEVVRLNCYRHWAAWEFAIETRKVNDADIEWALNDVDFVSKFSRIENHYFTHGGFLRSDSELLEKVSVLNDHKIPGIIIHGRLDFVCPMTTAYELHKSWPNSKLVIAPQSGHGIQGDPQMLHEIVCATDSFRDLV